MSHTELMKFQDVLYNIWAQYKHKSFSWQVFKYFHEPMGYVEVSVHDTTRVQITPVPRFPQ